MLPYISTKIPETISVKGIITVFKRKFFATGGISEGEAHDFPELLYIERGSHNMSVDGKCYELKAGDAIIYAPRAFHFSEKSPEADVFIVSFELEAKEISLYNKVINLDFKEREALREIVEEALPCFTRRPRGTGFHGMTLNDGVSEFTLEKIKKKLEFFLLALAEKCSSNKKKSYGDDIERVKKFCLENLDKSLSLYDIAKGANMSVSKLKLLFRNFGGAISFFNEMKIDKAKQFIDKGDLNFTEISNDLGFASLHYFSRLFKKKTGLSPSEYAKKE